MVRVFIGIIAIALSGACGSSGSDPESETATGTEVSGEPLEDVESLSATAVCENMMRLFDCDGDWGIPDVFMSSCPDAINGACDAEDMTTLSRFFACMTVSDGTLSCSAEDRQRCVESQAVSSLTQSCDGQTSLER